MSKLKIIAGSYDRIIIGLSVELQDLFASPQKKLKVEGDNAVNSLTKITPLFNYAPHSGAIRSVAVCGKYLASGGSEEIIKYSIIGLFTGYTI